MTTLTAELHHKLTEAEARALTVEIREGMEGVHVKVLRAYEGEVWEPMGYADFRAWATKEFEKAQSRIYQLLNYARVEKVILSTNGGKADLNERQARELRGLNPEQVCAAITAATEAAKVTGKRRTTEHVIDAVATVTGKPRANAAPQPPHAPGTISDAELDDDKGDPVWRTAFAFRECDDRQKFKAIGQQLDDMSSKTRVTVAALILSTLSPAEIAELSRQVDFAALIETSKGATK